MKIEATSATELESALRELSRLRHSSESGARAAEEFAEACFGASRRLAVYGSLAPGEPNHGVVADLAGPWTTGTVTGQLEDRGWGARAGYPGIRLVSPGVSVPVHVLQSPDLPRHWQRLDDFEGEEYRRSLVLVHAAAGPCVANIYELR